MKSVVIADALRTPMGKMSGALASVPATELGALTVKALLQRTKIDPKAVDLAIFGNVLTTGLGQNPARQAALRGGLPPTVSAFQVGMVCGSGMKAVHSATQAIKAGDAELALEHARMLPAALALLAAAVAVALLPPIGGLPLSGYASIALLLAGSLLLVPTLTARLVALAPATGRPAFDVGLAQLRGTAGQRSWSTASCRYSGRKSWPHCETQCASSIANSAFGSGSSQARKASVSRRSGAT